MKPALTNANASEMHPCRRRYEWSAVDMSQDDGVIALQLGCTPEAVRLRRRKLERERTHGVKPRSRFDWLAVDWSGNDDAIAKKLGCVPSYVAYRRRKHAPPEHRSKRSGAPSAADRLVSTIHRLQRAAVADGHHRLRLDAHILADAVNVPGQKAHPLDHWTIVRNLSRVCEALRAQGHQLQGDEATGFELVVSNLEIRPTRLAGLDRHRVEGDLAPG